MSIVFGGVKVFDQSIVGSTPNYSKPEFQRQISAAEKFFVLVRASGVSGSPNTMVVLLEHSNDGVNWATKATLVASVSIVGGLTTTGLDLGTAAVGGALMRLNVTLSGTTPAAYIEAWLTGRTLD